MSTRPVFELALGQSLRRDESDIPAADVRHDADACACGFVPDGSGAGAVYNEEAFRYFLDIERRRAELSNRPFVLLLVDLTKQTPVAAEMDAAASQTLMSALSFCVRETDFIGWYRGRSVAGAVLTQHSDAVGAD